MSSKPRSTLTWVIDNFSSVGTNQSPEFKFENDSKTFFLDLARKHSLPVFHDCTVLYLRRNMPFEEDIQVVSTISVLDKNSHKHCTQVSQTFFTKENNEPETGGLFFIRNKYLLDATNGLLLGDKLTLHCEVEILNNKDTIALNKILDQDKKMASLMKTIENYQSLLESCKLSDVVFVIGDKEFKLHKAILSAQSPVFSAMFTNDLSEAKHNRVDIIDVNVEVFEAMIRFHVSLIYTANIDSVKQYALELFVAADKYQLDSLKDICAQFLGSNLTIKSVTNILLVADMHSEQQLKSKCVQYINSNAEEVVLTAEWNQMVKDNNSTQLLHLLYLDLVAKSKGFKQVKL